MYLCYSTVFETLRNNISGKGIVKTLINNIWSVALQECFDYEDDENSYKYHRGTEIPNSIKKKVFKNPVNNIAITVNGNITPLFKQSKLLTIIKTINILLKYDNIITDDKIICENPRYTKKEFLNKNVWEFEQYMAIILKYIFTNDNELKGDLIENRVKFAISKIDECHDISLIPFGTSFELPITVETNKDRFEQTFKELLHPSTIDLARDNHLKLFMLDILNNKFDYTNIKKLYKYYLSDYVLSKNDKLKYEDQEELQMKFYDAIKKTPNTTEFKESILGNLLLYTFLEQVLNAPKLFNSITLSSTHSKSEAVHMLNVDSLNTKLIFGTSEILSDINLAITTAFRKIKTIESVLNEERNILMDFRLLNSEFDTDTAEKIKSIVIPTKSTSTPAENAFSIFIGYTLEGVDKTLSNDEYLSNVQNKLILDIHNSSELIKSKINELELYGYSFYIYFVPFNKAELDKLAIVEV